MKRRSIFIDDNVYDFYRNLAAQVGAPVGQVIRNVLNMYAANVVSEAAKEKKDVIRDE